MFVGSCYIRSRRILSLPSALGALSLALISSAPGLAQPTSAPPAQVTIPAGTILPVVLRSTISSSRVKQGQRIEGKIAQDVPLSDGSKIRAGTKLIGQVVDVTRATDRTPGRVSLRFEELQWQGKAVPVRTDLRAIAGFVAIQDAEQPDEAPSEGSPFNWLPTTQIGGDSVYGVGGPVMSAEDSNKQVGKSVNGGVLGEVQPNEGRKCRGPIDGNSSPQALWVFSSDACGTYGLSHLVISHAGRTEPVGTIVLESQSRDVALRNGDGLLLRVIG